MGPHAAARMADGASLLSHLECARCSERHDADRVQNQCTKCSGPLLARYDLARARTSFNPLSFGGRPSTMWRYEELLPLRDTRHLVTLGEGSTPLLHLARLGGRLGLKGLLLKDEGRNPTGAFKARGLACAVSRNVELGVSRFAIPTAGNAGEALAVYAAAAGVEAFVAMPRDTPTANRVAIEQAGAKVHYVEGTITEAATVVRDKVTKEAWFDVSTLKEPYRLEGKKTMGFEMAEALGWSVPDVVVYPTGGGSGLLGIWKAFEELEAAGILGSRRPRMVAVQSETCAPIVRAFRDGADTVTPWENPRTIASGLRVPRPFADREILGVVRASRGTCVAVPDEETRRAMGELASTEGVQACPEGATTLAALRRLLGQGWIEPKESVVLLNTGSAAKYVGHTA